MTLTPTAAPSSTGPVQRIEGFPVGYYALHPDVSLNYQMNRFSTGEADMINEMRHAASQIQDYADYTREFLALAERALDGGRKLEGRAVPAIS